MASRALLPAVLAIAAFAYVALAADPNPLQQFCVADLNSQVFVNGFPCKNPKTVTAEDFKFSSLKPKSTANKLGFNVTVVNVNLLPGLNTLGAAVARLDYAPYGLNPLHTHPRSTEVLTVLEGTLLVGFITENPADALLQTTLHAGDVFVFPIGSVHFQFNVGETPAVAIAAFGSQNPGLIVIRDSVFGTTPPISDDVLSKAFGVDKEIIDELKAQFK